MDRVIRGAKASDLAICAALAGSELGGGWTVSALSALLASPGGRIWVACASSDAEAEVLGFAVGRRVLALLEIDVVAVSPNARRRGTGRAILGALLEAEGRAGAEEAQLELRASNEAAAGLYTGLGFVVVGRRARYYPDGEDALLLSRPFA